MSRKILFMSSAKLTAICVVLLLAVFGSIGMSFRPVYGEDEEELVMSGPRYAHWVSESPGCSGTSYTYNNKTDYGKAVAKTLGGGSVSVSNGSNSTSAYTNNSATTTGTQSYVTWNTNFGNSNQTGEKNDLAARHSNSFTLTATPADGYLFVGWYAEEACTTLLSSLEEYKPTVVIPGGVYEKGTIKTEEAAKNKYGNWQSSGSPYTETFYAKFQEITPVDLTFVACKGGTYTVTINSSSSTVSTSDVVKTGITTSVSLSATPAEGYVFTGWYQVDGNEVLSDLSSDASLSKSFSENLTIGARFVSKQTGQFQIGSTTYYGLKAATIAAQANDVIIPVAEETVVDGSDLLPLDNGIYTIPANVKLLIPYNSSNSFQTLPKVVTTAATLSAYRKLVLMDGVNIVVSDEAAVCVGGQAMAASGSGTGGHTGYTTGACGLLDMSRGGHLELNSGATLYCWGFVKGQDMEQGNNTQDVGTITVNSDAIVWENFSVGDWRGGSATSSIMNTRFFPFQNYFTQNIEVPTTYKYGAYEWNYFTLNATGGPYDTKFTIIGNENCLFKLTDANSKVRKWYDPTTDLICYELSGSAVLDELKIKITGLPLIGTLDIQSSNYDLPITTNMHIILTDCNMSLTKPMVVQPGAIIEIKQSATVTLSNNLFLYDKDEWGPWVTGKYFRSNSNLTTHKNRGDGSSNEYLDDATFLINGTLNISSNGKLYTTASGAALVSSGGGVLTYPATLPSSSSLKWYKGATTSGEGETGTVAVNVANMCNEDESYTQAVKSTTFLNINGRWFTQAAATANKSDHTYDFTYIRSGAVSGTGGTNTTTDAVYSWDKTGLELRQKWFNVTADCNEEGHYWWHGQGEQTGWFYNWTLNSAWHQFLPTATIGMYSGSNNTLYTKSSCTWEELGSTDVNCLYEIGGVKKALVDGQFVALSPNDDDPAYHETEDPTKYYICFEGCNWHAADKYTEAKKAYIIEPDTFIWYNNAWMSVNFKKPFAYTLDETNVPVYYEYVDGDWTLAEPYVRVVDGLEDRSYYFLDEAFKFASSVLRTAPTITILRDISGITTAISYTGTKTCTLDLNGKMITGSVSSMLTINGTGCTFIIEDNTNEKNGKINLYYSANGRRYAVNVTKGHLKLKSGTISSTNTMLYATGQTSTTSAAIIVKASQQCTIEGGRVYAQADHNPFGIYGEGNSSTITVKGGEVIASVGLKTEPRGIQVTGGTLNVKDDALIEATTYSSGTTGEGIFVNCAAGYHATLNMTGGTVKSTTKTSSIGVYVNCAYTYDTNEPRNITAWSRAEANISAGEIQVSNINGSTAEGVRSLGTTNISGGKITVRPTTTTAFGVRLFDGTTTISNNADIDVSATSGAYGVRISQEAPANKAGTVYNGILNMTGGKLTVRTSSTTEAYGVYVGASSTKITTTHASNSSYYAGNYANAGTATISGGLIDVQARTTKAYGVYVVGPVSQSGAEGYPTASATPNCSITGGKFKVSSMSGSTTEVAATNVSSSTYTISGGYYNNQENIEGYTVAPKHVVTLPTSDANYPEYLYKVANAYQVTFFNGEDVLQSSYQQEGIIPTYMGAEPQKASDGGYSYEFDGWSTTNGGPVVNPLPAVSSAGATYYAHFEATDLRYTISLDATTNGGTCAEEYIRIVPGSAAGELPSAAKEGHTFAGWFTAVSGGTQLTSSTVVSGDIKYYAQFAVNSYTLTYELGEGAVKTAGVPFPAKNKTGTQSQSVAYGTAITAPVVTRTGYTFSSWDVIVAPTMPAENVTYTPLWNPNTNTAYTVKHLLQDADGSGYTEVTEDKQALTGTTGATVTPDPKSYDGFITPAKQSLTIAADGKAVLEYNYDRVVYTINWNASANGGMCAMASTDVRHGATLALPAATKAGHILDGWYTKAEGGNKISDGATILQNYGTLYAQFVPTYTIIWYDEEDNELSREEKLIGESLTPPDYSKEDTQEWDYTFHGWNDGTTTYAANAIPAVSGAATYTADITKVKNNYTLTIGVVEAGYGSVTETSVTVPYGTAVSTSDNVLTIGTTTVMATPTASTVEYTYAFDHWNNVPASVMGNVNNIQAVFTRTLNTVTITWKNGDDVIETDEGVVIGSTPSFDGDTPTKATDENFGYTFDGWSATNGGDLVDPLPSVSGNTTYYAHYSTTPTVASVEVSESAKYYTTLQAAFDYAADKTEPTITVLDDITLAAKVTYTNTSKTTVTFDLNGHIISGAVNALLTLTSATNNGGTFIIKSDVEGGQIRNTPSSSNARSCVTLSKGKLALQSGTIYNENGNTGASYAVNVASGRTFTMTGGTLEAKGKKSVYALYSAGTSNVSGGKLLTTETTSGSTAGVCVIGGTTTISGETEVDVNGTSNVYGALASMRPSTSGAVYNGILNISGGTFTVDASNSTAYGVYSYAGTRAISEKGNYACAGTVTISGGEFTVTSAGATACGVFVTGNVSIASAKDADGNATYAAASATSKATITGGKFNVSGTSSVGAVNTSASNTALDIQGGWYNINTNLSGYVAPTKSCNYWTLDLDDETYKYEVAEAYKVSWDATTNGGTCATPYTIVKKSTAIGTLPVATKTGHDFLGWFTTISGGGNQVTTSTVITTAMFAYARFAPSTYDITYKDQGDTDFSGAHGEGYPTTHTYGTATALINPTKYGYTFEGWYDNAGCTGSALTEIGEAAFTADFTLYAKWAIKTNCTITWLNYDGTTQLHQSTTSWGSTPYYPAHLGTPTRPGDEHRTYTFKGWSPEIHPADGDETYIAQYNMSITTGENGSYTVSGAEDAIATTVQVSGALYVPEYNSLTTTDLILEASDNSSGMIEGIERLQVNGNAYFDYEFDTDPWHWSAFGVPFEIDLDAAALLKEKTTPLVLGSDYDIVYYDSEERALHGPSTNCWKYVEYNSHTLVPGRLYMIAFNRPLGHVNVIRFTKASGAAVDFTSNVPLYNDGSGINDNWNGVANPKLFHALLNAGVTECQVHDGGEIKKDGYDMYDMNNKKFFVGKAVFVQVPYNQSPMYADPATTQGPIVVKAPRRTRAEESAERYDVKIAPMAEEMEDHIYLLASEDKADEYVIVADLVKAGVSPVRAQMWVERYGVQLCKNTTEWINNVADYPLGISVPADGDYDIWLEDRPDNDDLMYLTLDGERIWNLSYGACTIELKKGTTQRYGIRVISNAPSVTTGMDAAGVLNEESIRKVLIDEKVYIIRNGELYSITGQKAK